MRKKTPAPDQPSLFENPAGPTAAEWRQSLIEEFKKSKAEYYVEANKKRRKKSRLDSIRLLDDSDTPEQASFAHITPVGPYPPGCFPPLGEAERVEAILTAAQPGDWVGLDFEFNPSNNDRITIIGVANSNEAAGCKWDPSVHTWLLRSAIRRNVKMVGHWVLGADKPVLEKALMEPTPDSSWVDSMGLHFLCNQCLCKSPGKQGDGEGSLGYMSLHHATCINTDTPAGYKSCRNIGCEGPCPRCAPLKYCAVDAYVGLISAINCREKMQRQGIPWRCYEEWHESTLGALVAEQRGIRIDKPFIEAFDKQGEERKANLFRVPSAKRPRYEPFNPKSGKQVAEWFKARRVRLVDAVGKVATDKKIVLAALEQEIKKYGFVDIEEFEKNADSITLSDVDAALYKLFLYKDSGKGMKPWFDEDKHLRYHDGAWWVHPRFNTTGASTTRLSSSSPNFQNIPSRGWGSAIKKAVVPRDDGSCILCSDASQLEHRIILYECGETPPPGDFFKWLLARAEGNFARAAERMHGNERDIAKRVSHACLTAGHEVLTLEKGWIPIENYAGERICSGVWDQYVQTYRYSFCHPKQYLVYDLDSEPLIKINGSLNAEVTINHKFPVWQGDGRTFVEAAELYTNRIKTQDYYIFGPDGNHHVKKLKIEKTFTKYKKVYCFSTHSQTFLVRRNGTIHLTGNSNYAEGFKLLEDWQLTNSQTLKQVDQGALRIFGDWRMSGKTVAFTGANLAETLFGDKTFESRKKALELQFDIYFKAVPFIHQWHRRLSALVERGHVQLRTGHRLELLDDPQSNFKAGAAFFGQGGGAQYVQAKMREANRRYPGRPWAAQIHDEIFWDSISKEWTVPQKLDFVQFLWKEEVDQFPGLLIPWKTKTGPSWGEAKEIVAA